MKSLRIYKQITAQELGNFLRVTKQAVGHWETGIRLPDLPTLIQISDYFNIPLEFLTPRVPYDHPTGQISYNIHDNNNNKIQGSISYFYGIYPFKNSFFEFIFLQDVKGMLVSKSIYDQFYFLYLINLINNRLKIGYLPNLPTELHQIDLVISYGYSIRKLNLSNNDSLLLDKLNLDYETFVYDYLESKIDEKIEHLKQFLA